MIVRLWGDDAYTLHPVNPADAELGWGQEYDLPDELAREYLSAEAAFHAADRQLSAYLRAVNRDQHAYEHDAEINRRRLERGQRRPQRRAHPERA